MYYGHVHIYYDVTDSPSSQCAAAGLVMFYRVYIGNHICLQHICCLTLQLNNNKCTVGYMT